MATIAMQYIVDFAITHIPGVSGGGQASIEVPPVRFLGLPIEGDLPTYYMALAVCAVITLFMLNVGRTGFGRALAALRERDYAAEIIGIDTFKYKLLAFWTSSFIGGVVGSVLVVCYLRSVSPDQFHLDLSIQILAMVIVGGLGSVLGSFFGAGLVLFAPIVFNNLIGFAADRSGIAISTDLRAHLPLMLYGALIIVFLVVEPLGLAKIYDNVRNYFLSGRSARPGDEKTAAGCGVSSRQQKGGRNETDTAYLRRQHGRHCPHWHAFGHCGGRKNHPLWNAAGFHEDLYVRDRGIQPRPA